MPTIRSKWGEFMATVDLRPMSLGEVLDRTFTLYRENFLLFAGIAALPQLLMLLFNFGLLATQRSNIRNVEPGAAAGLMGGFLLGALVAVALALLFFAIAQAATISAVSDLYLGRETSIRNAYANAKGSVWIVVAIVIMVFLATVVGFMLLIIPGIILMCRLALAVPAAIVEKDGAVRSMERSMELTRGYFWQMFLLLLLVGVLTWIVGTVLQLPVVASSFTAALAKQQVSVGVSIYSYLAQFVSSVLVGPIGTISASLMYYNLRVQKEGFDIQHLFSSLGNADTAPRPLSM
jgi:hypothetical protein